MGVQDLSRELRASKKLDTKLSDFEGKILGVDTSIWLNKAIFASPEISVLFHQEPRVTVGHLIDIYFDRFLTVFKENKIKVLFVLDGARNPLKASTNEARRKKSLDASEELVELIASGDYDNFKKITALKKKAVYVREDITADFVRWCDKNDVKYVCAFMEAEWELCRLEKDGIIDAVVSEDSDCFVLGCKKVIQLLDINIDPLGLNCTLVTGSCWTTYVNNILPNPTTAEMADFAVLLGVDYLDRAYGNSVNKVSRFFPKWRDIREETLSHIQSHGQVGGSRTRPGIPGYVKTFTEASNIFQFAPCFCVQSVTEGQSQRVAFWSESYIVHRGNLNLIAEGDEEKKLFGFNPNDSLPAEFESIDMFRMKVWIRSLCPIDSFIIPFPMNDRDEILPWGCYLDFDIVPVGMQPTQTLITYLECRGLSPRASNTRAQLVSAVERVRSQGANGPAILPCTDVVGGGHYVNLEVLTCDEPIVWEANGDMIFKQIKDMRTRFDEQFIDLHFGTGRNGVRERAWGRINGGHFDISTFQSTACNCRTPAGIEPVRIFSIKCTPSMKKDVYTIYLILRSSDDTFLQAPASRCNCPVGRLFCSHMLAFIVLLGMMQSLNDDETFQWFAESMPDPVKSLHSLCIPFQYVF